MNSLRKDEIHENGEEKISPNDVHNDKENLSNEKVDDCYKRKRGRKQTISSKIVNLKEVLKRPDFKGIISSNGEIAPPSLQIYTNISDAMESTNKLNPKYIYTILLENRYSVYSELTEHLEIEPPLKDVNLNESSILNTSNNTVEFRLDVTEIWPSMCPEANLYHFTSRDRIIRKLRKNSWTHVLYEQILNITNIPCALVFSDSKITESVIFVTVNGTCPECPCEFKGHILEEPKEKEAIMMECAIINFNEEIEHKNKRQLQGELRSAVGNVLVEKNLLPSQHRRNEAHRLITTVGDKSPPNLYKGSVLSKAKQQCLNKQLGLIHPKALDNLYTLKYDNKYQGAIRNIGIDPIFIYYWSKEQQIIFEKFPGKLYVDGTGSIVKKIKLPNNNSCPHIYLYQALVDVNGKSVPVFQMLSSCQTTVAIMTWLLEFRRIGYIENPKYPFPKEVITDFDKALLGALARAIIEVKSLMCYSFMCFDLIIGKKIEIPHCLLRLDVCHFTKMIAILKCFRKCEEPEVRCFYLRAMCILRKQENFKEFEAMATSILTVALCRSGIKGSPASEAKEFLRLKIKGIIDETTETILKETENFGGPEKDNNVLDEDEESYVETTSLGEWVKKIYEEVKQKAAKEKVAAGDEINGHRLPEFAKYLKNLLVYFPLYTEIMRKLCGFGTVNPTSAPVESYFNDLKNRSFKAIGLPVRIDKFVVMHLLEIEKKLKEAATGALTITESGEVEAVLKKSLPPKTKLSKKRKRDNLKKEQKHDYNNASLSELNQKHNWRQKNEKLEENSTLLITETEESEEEVTLDLTNSLNCHLEKKPKERYEEAAQDSGNDLEKEKLNVKDLKESPKHKEKNNGAQLSESLTCHEKDMKKEEEKESDNDLEQEISECKNLQACLRSNKKKKGAQYGEYCPEFEPSLTHCTYLPILPNASRCHNVRERLLITVIANSCAIDSLLHVLSMLIVNDKHYQTQITDVDSAIFLLAKLFIKEKVTADVYRERAKILRNSSATIKDIKQYNKPCKRSNTMMSIVKINAICNVSELATNLFDETPSYTIDYTCKTCKMTRTDVFPLALIDLQIINDSGIVNLLPALKVYPKKKQTCCNKVLEKKTYYGPHLLISVDVGSRNEARICDIPQRLQMETNNEYQIAGIVAYFGSYLPSVSGHYTAFTVVGQKWLEYDDLSSSKSPYQIENNEVVVDPHFLIYSKIPTSI